MLRTGVTRPEMRTTHVIIMLALAGGIAAWQMRDLLRESPWYGVPMLGVIIFAAVFHHFIQRPGAAAKKRALLFAVGIVAVVATGVFVAFGFSFVRLLRSGALSFDAVWSVSAVAAGALATWLWFRFVRLLRKI
jgi:hypothetical protein